MAGDALDLGVGEGFDEDVIADPVDADFAHGIGPEGEGREQGEGGKREKAGKGHGRLWSRV
ncbi:hypothetical protein GCM10011452_07350 [Gemmobacter lanyuensis]|uniref:Uncharacterized protein n=1 Tax=Gemmobacter lanyuensis TaxID=1054497 RepID=A0A918MGV0_9RHOB|nr:hypothetical protein GCM10011452_07350 [Gemmobacter lanyuensis]